MSLKLKNEFKKILELLISDDSDCYVEEGFCCEIEDDCETYKCRECKSKHKIDCEIYFENMSEDIRRLYIFGNKKVTDEKIVVIHNKSEMYKELYFLKETVINKLDKENLELFDKIKELRKYADEFFSKLIDECFPYMNKKILPIRFHDSVKNIKNVDGKVCCTAGEYYKKGKQNIIHIYSTEFYNIEQIKKHIRHEIIHYALDMNNLKNDDDSGIFHGLCKIYDGGSYMEMNEKEKGIYDKFMLIYDSRKILFNYINLYNKTNHPENILLNTLIKSAGSKNKEKIDLLYNEINLLNMMKTAITEMFISQLAQISKNNKKS